MTDHLSAIHVSSTMGPVDSSIHGNQPVRSSSPIPTPEISHAFIQWPPLQFNIAGATGVMYDEGSRQVVVSSFSKIYSWPVAPRGMAATTSDSPRMTIITDGPVLSVRFSTDRRILAVQRSIKEVEIVTREGTLIGHQRCRRGAERILGFFWTDAPSCDLVFVTSSGLELYEVGMIPGAVRFVDTKKVTGGVGWYNYTQESRMLLLASGPFCTSLSTYQFAATGLVKVPRFEAELARRSGSPQPILSPEDVKIATMYGKVYCVVVDRVALKLQLLRYFRDAVVPQASLPLYSSHVAISVVDNVLLVHQTDSKVVLVFDPYSPSPHPIASPLTLTIRPALVEKATSETNLSSSSAAAAELMVPARPVHKPDVNSAAISSEERSPSSSSGVGSQILPQGEEETYGEGWLFLTPDLILDHARGLLWRLHIDLEAIAASCQELNTLLAFLQRRRLEPRKAKELSVAALRSLLMDAVPLTQVGDAFDIATSFFASTARGAHGGRLPYQFANRRPPPRPVGALLPGASLLPGPYGMAASGMPGLALTLTPGAQPGQVFSQRATHGIMGMKYAMDPASGATPRETQDHHETQASSQNQELDLPGSTWQQSGSSSGPGLNQNESCLGATEEATKSEAGTSRAAAPAHLLQREGTSTTSGGRVPEGISGSYVAAAGAKKPLALWQQQSPALSPDEFFTEVFLKSEEDSWARGQYLVAVIIVFMRSAAGVGLRVPDLLHRQVARLLVQEEHFHHLWELVHSEVIEASLEVATFLLEQGQHHPLLREQGLDMLRQLGAHKEYATELAAGGQIVAALRHLRKHQILDFSPTAFLELAAAKGGAQLLATTLRGCAELFPSFRGSAEYNLYTSMPRSQ